MWVPNRALCIGGAVDLFIFVCYNQTDKSGLRKDAAMKAIQKVKELRRKYGRFADAFIALFLIPQAMYFIVTEISKRQYEGGYEFVSIYICLGLSLLSFYSIFRITIMFDRPLRDHFSAYRKDNEKKSKLVCIVGQKRFWIRASVMAIPYLVFPLDWTCKIFAVLFGVDSFIKKLPVLAILYAVLLCIGVLSYLSAMSVWNKNGENAEYSEGEYKKSCSAIVSVYLCAAILLTVIGVPLMVPIVIAVFKEVGPKLILYIFLFSGFVWCVRALFSLKKRRGFLKELRSVCEGKGVVLSPINRPYRSALIGSEGENFHFSVGDKSYSCKMIASPNKRLPAIISTNGIITYVHTVRLLKYTIFQYNTKQKFAYETDGKKIVILNPVPKHIYISNKGRRYELDNGDTVGNYKLFTASGFLNALERDVLDR